jgi:Protein of unknown function (DUF1559)
MSSINARWILILVGACCLIDSAAADSGQQDKTGNGSARSTPGFQHLHNVGLALHGYHDFYGHFPPAVLTGPDGKTTYSWRVEILPVLKYYAEERNSEALAGVRPDDRATWWNVIRELGYNPDEPWDSADNRRMLERIPESYRRPGDPESHSASVFLVTGPAAASSIRETISLSQMRDPGRTLMLVEAKRDVPWTKPEDIEYSTFKPVPDFGGFLDDGFLVATFDGAVHPISGAVPEKDLRALITLDATDTFTITGIPWHRRGD